LSVSDKEEMAYNIDTRSTSGVPLLSRDQFTLPTSLPWKEPCSTH